LDTLKNLLEVVKKAKLGALAQDNYVLGNNQCCCSYPPADSLLAMETVLGTELADALNEKPADKASIPWRQRLNDTLGDAHLFSDKDLAALQSEVPNETKNTTWDSFNMTLAPTNLPPSHFRARALKFGATEYCVGYEKDTFPSLGVSISYGLKKIIIALEDAPPGTSQNSEGRRNTTKYEILFSEIEQVFLSQLKGNRHTLYSSSQEILLRWFLPPVGQT
jgi:hypothetical protein